MYEYVILSSTRPYLSSLSFRKHAFTISRDPRSTCPLSHGIGTFLLAFSVSMALGVAFCLTTRMLLSSQTLVARHAPFHRILLGRIVRIYVLLSLMACPCLGSVASRLWHHAQALGVPRHVSSHATRHQIYLQHRDAALGEPLVTSGCRCPHHHRLERGDSLREAGFHRHQYRRDDPHALHRRLPAH